MDELFLYKETRPQEEIRAERQQRHSKVWQPNFEEILEKK